MKLKRKYKLLILLLAIFILSVNGYSQDESHPPLIYQLSPPPTNLKSTISYEYMVISIRPASTFELRDPLGGKIIHHQEAKNIMEIPNADYMEESPPGEDIFTGEININSPVGGDYELKILNVPDKTYIFYVRVTNGEKIEKSDTVTLIDIPFQKGHPQTYDILFDKKNWKVKAKRR